MPYRAVDWSVLELAALAGTPEHQPAAAHVAAAHEVHGEHQPSPENFQQRISVLPRGDAAEENNARRTSDRRRELFGVATERRTISRIAGPDVHAAERDKVLAANRG